MYDFRQRIKLRKSERLYCNPNKCPKDDVWKTAQKANIYNPDASSILRHSSHLFSKSWRQLIPMLFCAHSIAVIWTPSSSIYSLWKRNYSLSSTVRAACHTVNSAMGKIQCRWILTRVFIFWYCYLWLTPSSVSQSLENIRYQKYIM